MINKLTSLSIKIKITFTIFFIILFFSIGMIYTAKITLTKNLTSSSVNITKDLIKVNETFIIKSLLEDDYWSIYKVLKSLSNLEVIKSIGLIDNKNIVIAHTQTDKYSIYQKFDLRNFKGTKIPLMSENLKLGTFVVTINKDAVNFLFKNIDKNLIIAMIILVFISFLIAYFISYRIIKRLDILSYNAKQIQDGNLDKIIKYKSLEKDEISKFQESMQIILSQLNSSILSEQNLKVFYHEILRGLSELVVISDEKFSILYHNEHNLSNLICTNTNFRDNILIKIQQNLDIGVNKFILEIESDDKEKLYLYIISEQSNSRYSFSFTDITKIKTLEERQQLVSSFELIGEISSSVVHEIKNHLQPIKLLVEQDKLDKEDHNRIIKIIKKIDYLINEFLNTGRPIDKSLSITIDINSIIEEKLFLFSNEIKAKSIKILKNYIKDVFILLRYDDCEIIVVNLLKNAIEASPARGIVSIETFQKDNYLVFKIVNQGKNIDNKIIKNISKPFFTTKNSGSGIGLYTTYKIVYLYGGLIDVASIANKTSFSVYLPKKEKS
ncbi:MAG: GHKL domain-containing protein [Epsilonproteobacteria bacterium]|nr:GHKL domain-containing protein [Campylobacterota bacterium]